ncbi:unnamed protein product, partial [Musa acuminata subsp. burmannicoides]
TSHSTAFVLISCNATICMLNAAEIDPKCVGQCRKHGGRKVNPPLEWISCNVMHQNADSCLHRRWMSRTELLHSLSEIFFDADVSATSGRDEVLQRHTLSGWPTG